MIYNVEKLGTINIGRHGENLARVIEIDVSSMLKQWPDATITLLVKRNKDEAPYVAVTELVDGILYWPVTRAETAVPGNGLIEIRATRGETIAKSVTGFIRVSAALTGNETEPPEQAKSWVDQVIEYGNEATQAAIKAKEEADRLSGINAKAVTLPAGSEAAVTVEDGYLVYGIPRGDTGEVGPQGPKGDKGETGADGKDAVVDATLTQSGQAADAKATGEAVGQLKDDLGDLSSFSPTAEYTVGIYQRINNVATFNGAVTTYHCAVIDVHSFIGKRVSLTLHHASNVPSFVTDKEMNIIDTISTTGANATIDRNYEITFGENAYYLVLNNFDTYESVIDGISYTVSDLLKTIPKVLQSDGDSDSAVMSQKAVTAYVKDRIPSINIEPVLPAYNRIPTVDSEVSLYLDNMFIGISPREAKLVTSQNAHIRFYDKTVAIIPNATESGFVRLHLDDDTRYQVSKPLLFESTTPKSGNKKVLFIGDSMTENLCYIKALKTISNAGDYKLIFLGTQFNTSYPDLHHEGRGGWAAYNYCNNDVFNNKTNAFWDGSKFNFSWYMQNSGIDVPDYIFINLGTNDMIRGIPSGATDEEMEEIITSSYQTMIDSIREYSNTIPIVLWLPPTRSLVGRNNHIIIDKCLRANKWLISKFDTKRNNRIYLMPTYLFVNPYTDYPTFTTTIDGVEYVDSTEVIHPSDAGGEKIAKGIIRQMMYIDGLIS